MRTLLHFAQTVAMSVIVLASAHAQTDYRLRDAVRNYLAQSNQGAQFVMLGEYISEETAVAYLWPCILNDALVDDKFIAVEFESRAEVWEAIQLYQHTQLPELFKTYPTQHWTHRTGQIPIDSIAGFIVSKSNIAATRMAERNSPEVVALYEAIAGLFPLDLIVAGTLYPKLVMQSAKSAEIYDIVIDGEKATAQFDLFYPTNAVSYNTILSKNGNGWVISGIKED